MTHLLDTDTCIGILRQQSGFVQRLQQLSPTDVAVSMVTVYELFCGIEKTREPTTERLKVARFLAVVNELPFDRASAEIAAQIRMDLERQGRPIGPYDLLIAGQALSHDLILVTNNVGEFQRVAGLTIESWS